MTNICIRVSSIDPSLIIDPLRILKEKSVVSADCRKFTFIDYRSVEDTESHIRHRRRPVLRPPSLIIDPLRILKGRQGLDARRRQHVPSLIIDPLRILKDASLATAAGQGSPSLIIDPLRILKVILSGTRRMRSGVLH